MKYLLPLLFTLPLTLWADSCWKGDQHPDCSEFTPIVPYVYVTPVAPLVPRVPPSYRPRARYSAPPLVIGVTPNSDSGPTTIMRFPDQGMTHIIQKGKVTTCFTIGENTVVCQ